MKKMKKLVRATAAAMLSMTLLLSSTTVFAGVPDDEGKTLLSGEINEQVVTNPRLRGILTNGPVTDNAMGGFESQRVLLSAAYSNYITIAYQNNKATPVTITLYKSDTAIKGDPGTRLTSWSVSGSQTYTYGYTVLSADRNKYLYIHIVPTGLETSVDGAFNWIQR